MDDRHTFWKDEPVGLGDGNREISRALKTEKEKLPVGYRFASFSMDADLEELYALIRNHYIGSREENMFLGYSRDFLKWDLDAIKCFPEYACVLKFKEDENIAERIVGFIYGKERHIVVGEKEMKLLGVNYFCLHTEHRKLGLAPVLIKEITRRAHQKNTTVAIFTGAKGFQFSFCRLQYFHRPINVLKLAELDFIPTYMNRYGRFRVEKPIKKMRPMRVEDVDGLLAIYNKECRNYEVYEIIDRNTFLHNFLPRKDVIYTYVVDDDVVREFVSFFIIDTVCSGSPESIKTAYLYYYASPEPERLVEDLVHTLKELEIDLLNLLNMGKNKEIVQNPAYLSGTGYLHYSFYNFQTNKVDPEKLFFVMH